MIQSNVINEIAVGVVGWKQPSASGSPTLSAENKASSSGLYFQHGNGLCTIANIKGAIDDTTISDANMNTYLEDLVKNAMNAVCSKVFERDDHLGAGLLFKHENKFSETLINSTDFVGFEIKLPKRNDLSAVVNSIRLELDAVDDVTVLLFNSQQNEAIDSEVITTVANSQTSATVRWTLNDLQYGGTWYIGYLRSGLTGKAIKRNYQLASLPTMFPGMEINPIRVDGWDAETMFNPVDITYESTANSWGMNFNVSVCRDWTEIVRSNVNRFATALQLQVCANVIDVISNSVRSDRNERLSKAYALMELDGNRYNPAFPEHSGILSRLNYEIKTLRETYNPTGIRRITL